MELTITTLRTDTLLTFANDNLDNDEIREVIEAIRNEEDDFEVGNFRIINDMQIDDILESELSGDEYILGCFTSWAIADATSWPVELVEAAQKGEQYEEIGRAMTAEHIENLAAILVQHDGYGHHFNRYDGGQEEFAVSDKSYYAFRID